jgi:flagellar biosynthetic protein FliR
MSDIEAIIRSIIPTIEPTDALLLFMLIFTRWLSMSLLMPFLGAQLIPNLVRVALASILSAFSFVLLMEQTTFGVLNISIIVLLFVKEACLGFILGFFSSLIFYVYELFGELLDFARAASMSKLLVPEVKHQSSAMGTMLFQFSLTVFLSFGFHRPLLTSAAKSFEIFPPTAINAEFFHQNLYNSVLECLSVVFEMAVSFSLPVILICFLIDLAFGLMNRVAPQINAYFLSLPAKIMGGLIALFFVLPFLLDDFSHHQHQLTKFFYAVFP